VQLIAGTVPALLSCTSMATEVVTKMSVTQEIFEAFLKCPRKSHLVSEGAIGAQSEFYEGQRRLEESYEQAASARLRSSLQPNEWYVGTHPVERLQERSYRLVFDRVIAEPDLRARLHALEVDCSRACARHHSYIPIRFVPKEKLTASDKLMLAFDAFVFWRATGELPAVGKIVYGRLCSAVRLHLSKFLRGVRPVIEKIIKQQAENTIPPVVLNKHCPECQFQSMCRQIAHEKDDLRLLATISDKERKKFHEKGIFTVTQLSYAFRLRRRSAPGAPKHFPALKALAIRKRKVHVLEGRRLSMDMEHRSISISRGRQTVISTI
jgi:predicted RecB family nuclease